MCEGVEGQRRGAMMTCKGKGRGQGHNAPVCVFEGRRAGDDFEVIVPPCLMLFLTRFFFSFEVSFSGYFLYFPTAA